MEKKKKFSILLQQNIEFFEKLFEKKFNDEECAGIENILREQLPKLNLGLNIMFDK